MSERIRNFGYLIDHAYHCKARHVASTPIRETFRGEIVWEGVVETFDLEGYPTASRCYVFEFARDTGPDIKIVLSVPGVDSPLKALRAALVDSARPK